MKKIAVVSQNKSFARFVELEILSCRFECDVFLKIPAQISEYSAVIVDTDTIDTFDMIPEKILISIGNNKTYNQKHLVSLPYPFLLEELRSALDMCVENNKRIESVSNQEYAAKGKNLFYLNDLDKAIFAFGQKISVSEYELKVLERLCETPGIAVSRKELSELLGSQGDTNIADVYVCHLRKKFERLSDKKVIYTIRSKGYMTNFGLIKE